MTHVPYKGGAALAAALLGGEVQGMFESPSAYLGNIRAGKLRALAVTGERRLAVLPEVPTLREQGLPDLEVSSWWGIVGPAKLPPQIVRRLNADISIVLSQPELREVLAKMSVEATPGTPEEFGAYLRGESARWRHFVATSGIAFDQ
jgi:tripartite-type tricarboxylate transporter receptor subunit TctC